MICRLDGVAVKYRPSLARISVIYSRWCFSARRSIDFFFACILLERLAYLHSAWYIQDMRIDRFRDIFPCDQNIVVPWVSSPLHHIYDVAIIDIRWLRPWIRSRYVIHEQDILEIEKLPLSCNCSEVVTEYMGEHRSNTSVRLKLIFICLGQKIQKCYQCHSAQHILRLAVRAVYPTDM